MKVLSIIVAAVLGIALVINLTYDPSPKTGFTDLQADLAGDLILVCENAYPQDWDGFSQCEQAALERVRNMSDEEIADLGLEGQQ